MFTFSFNNIFFLCTYYKFYNKLKHLNHQINFFQEPLFFCLLYEKNPSTRNFFLFFVLELISKIQFFRKRLFTFLRKTRSFKFNNTN